MELALWAKVVRAEVLDPVDAGKEDLIEMVAALGAVSAYAADLECVVVDGE